MVILLRIKILLKIFGKKKKQDNYKILKIKKNNIFGICINS